MKIIWISQIYKLSIKGLVAVDDFLLLIYLMTFCYYLFFSFNDLLLFIYLKTF